MELKKNMRTLVIVPTYNESENLLPLVAAILGRHPSIDLLIVDDNSPDHTGAMADELATTNHRVRVVHRPRKMGLGTAYALGFRDALERGYDYIVEMDADFSHQPDDLPRLLDAARSADVVIGSRNVPGGQVIGWSPLRHVISRGGSLFARLMLNLPMHDCTSGFKCFTHSALSHLDLDALRSNGYAFQVEVNAACASAGLQFAEVPIIFPDRRRGTSKMSARIVLEATLVVLQLRLGWRRMPLRKHAPALREAEPIHDLSLPGKVRTSA
jgi:dolichol-phosphate mannosyltransferase